MMIHYIMTLLFWKNLQMIMKVKGAYYNSIFYYNEQYSNFQIIDLNSVEPKLISNAKQ